MSDYTEIIKRLRMLSGTDNIAEFDEAADAIEELQNTYDTVTSVQKHVIENLRNDLDFAIRAETAAIKACTPRWIPVTETPPRKVGDDGYNGYLVYANGYYEVADYTTDKFDNVPFFHVDGEYESNVTHWMPLPEPPKEETE